MLHEVPPMQNITIKDIARKANVSCSTVSRALSGQSVSAGTRERVLEICGELGYTPNIIARSMVVKETYLIGLIVPTIDNPFMSELAYSVEQSARLQGYSVILTNSAHDLALEEEAFRLMLGRQVDGVIIVPSSAESYRVIRPYAARVPTVFLSENLRDAAESYVVVDHYQGAVTGMRYLYELGHREIYYFGRRKNSNTHKLRAEGYLEACRELGLTPHIIDSGYPSSTIHHGYTLAKPLFAKQKALPFTAVFAATDTLALGVLQAAEEFGYRVPEEFSLLGYDNIHYASLPKINLSTVEQPKPSMAAVAVELLLDKLQRRDAGYTHRVLMPTLIKRRSCTPAPGHLTKADKEVTHHAKN